MKPFACLLALVIAFPGVSVAQTANQPSGNAETTALSEQDQEFLARATRSGQMEVTLGKLAADKAAGPEVKQFAERMVRDHSKAGKKLKSVASKIGASPPTKPGEQARNLRQGLAQVQGDLFDREYMWNTVAAHTVAVNLFEEQIEDGTNPQLVSFADSTLPTLREHRQRAVQLWSKME